MDIERNRQLFHRPCDPGIPFLGIYSIEISACDHQDIYLYICINIYIEINGYIYIYIYGTVIHNSPKLRVIQMSVKSRVNN